MAEYCILGYLNDFVEVWGLHTTILSWMASSKKMSHTEVWDAIQASGLDASIKALEPRDIHTILEWMFGQGLIGKPENSTITYVIP